MNILAVDDEKYMLEALCDSIRAADSSAQLFPFQNGKEALSFAEQHAIDVAFLDVKMRGLDGLELGRELKVIRPEINLIYCTGYEEYVEEAFRSVRCNGYITKPVDVDSIVKELNHLRIPMHKTEKNRVLFRCFGRFEAYIDNKPIEFDTPKTKELLAVLVNACGGVCTNPEIKAKIWGEDTSHDSYFKKMRKDLIDTMERYGCSDVLHTPRGGLGINLSKVTCDYYDWRKKHSSGMPPSYMVQYPWAAMQFIQEKRRRRISV